MELCNFLHPLLFLKGPIVLLGTSFSKKLALHVLILKITSQVARTKQLTEDVHGDIDPFTNAKVI
jgi:hypothetical protein